MQKVATFDKKFATCDLLDGSFPVFPVDAPVKRIGFICEKDWFPFFVDLDAPVSPTKLYLFFEDTNGETGGFA